MAATRSALRESGAGGGTKTPAAGAIRLDKWLWFARFLRARGACQALIRDGHVRVNARRITRPGASVRPGDVLTLALPGRTLLVEILMAGERRGGAQEACALYRVIDPSSFTTGQE